MTDNINPSHYKDGPFECIELSRLLSSDWGQAVQYCFRWQHKNGVEDLKKALWFINDAITHNVPFFAACCKRNGHSRSSGNQASWHPTGRELG